MRRMMITLAMVCVAAAVSGAAGGENVRRLPVEEYVDKMKAGWVGQMAGVGWGGPTEFRWRGEIIPADQMPKWSPEMVNQFNQDDIYVEMTFIQTLEDYGFDVCIRQAGIDFANSGYQLWHANILGRSLLRNGIAPPDSGHPQFNNCADDIDYQIQADYSGLIAPGMPQIPVELGEKFGRLMNYGDGVYAGQYVGAMYAEAFSEKDIIKVIRTTLQSIPEESQYAEMVRDMLTWYEEEKNDWQATWEKVEEKYHTNPDYVHGRCSKPGDKGDYSIDAKLNGAYVLMGLLYGKGDIDQTILISMRCGQDSDCNPSTAAGVLCTTLGFSNLPEKFTSALDMKGKFNHSRYDFPGLVEVSKKLVREAVERSGGKISTDESGNEVLEIPTRQVKPSELFRTQDPGPLANSKFTAEEMAKITRSGVKEVQEDLEQFAPGWKLGFCDADRGLGLKSDWNGKQNIFKTHPLSLKIPFVLSKIVDVPAGKKTSLTFAVSHRPLSDWTLVVKAGGKELLTKKIAKETCPNGWAEIVVDLSVFAGKSVKLELENAANGWNNEYGYWAELAVVSE